MSNSSLVYKTIPSPNNSGARTKAIDRITPHCTVGQCTIESLGALFANPDRRGSSNYGIDKDGKIGLFVDEGKRAWTSGSAANDQRAVTIECASDAFQPYRFNDCVYNTLVKLCADICKRNEKNELLWISDKDTALRYEPQPNEMILTVHRWFQATACPGDWMFSRMPKLAKDVNDLLDKEKKRETEPTIYRVQVGAFTSKVNANALCEKVKAAGFSSAFVVKSGNEKE